MFPSELSCLDVMAKRQKTFGVVKIYNLGCQVKVSKLNKQIDTPLPSPYTDSKAIVDGNLKLILGVVWTLIQHYSISTPVWEDEANDSVSKLTPETRLLGWIQNKVPELPITNFSQDWQDGKALGALVDGLAPGKPRFLYSAFSCDFFLFVRVENKAFWQRFVLRNGCSGSCRLVS